MFAVSGLTFACGRQAPDQENSDLQDAIPAQTSKRIKIGNSQNLCIANIVYWRAMKTTGCNDGGSATHIKHRYFTYDSATKKLYHKISSGRGFTVMCAKTSGKINEGIYFQDCLMKYDAPPEFAFEYVNEGFVHIASGLCLNVNNGYSVPNTPIVLNKCGFDRNGKRIDKQRFVFE
jgi:hypothetical protein